MLSSGSGEIGRAGVTVLGAFVADLAFSASRLPLPGETLAGSAFAAGPGGKGSNQAVAAARAGAAVRFISRIGQDAFGEMAKLTWASDGISAHVIEADEATGAAFIYVNTVSGENAIIVVPGAAAGLTADDVEAVEGAIISARVFVTQLEQPVSAARRGLELARAAGVTTVFNPAPAEAVPDDIFPLCDFIVPNETEAATLTGAPVESLQQVQRAGDVLLSKGVGVALITLGARGVLFHDRDRSVLVPAIRAGDIIDTTGAGDAFVGGFAAALSKGVEPLDAARFGCAVASLAVTRPGTAPAMPHLGEVQNLLQNLPV